MSETLRELQRGKQTMLIFESDLLNALDFLFIISGAPVESIENRLLKDQQLERVHSLQLLKEERDRRYGLFLFQENNRFLEVLYLKTAFLDQIVRRVFSNLGSYQYPELGCSLDRIWIQFIDASNMIPRSWNFKIRLIQDDLDKATAKPPSFPKFAPAYGYYFLGLIWLFTLVLNRRQGSTTIYSAAEKMVEQIPSAGDFERNRAGGALDPVFSSENIYWKPEANRKPNADRKIWEKSIWMGLSLLKEGLNPSHSVLPEEFIRELDFLREEIRIRLFRRRSFAVPGPRMSREDLEIRNILIRIRNRLSEHVEEHVPMEDSSKNAFISNKEELAETVVLHRDSLKEARATATDVPEKDSEERHTGETIETDMPETEIIRPASVRKTEAPDRKGEDSTAGTSESEMVETVVLQRGSFETGTESEEVKRFPGEAGGDDDLAETRVLGREKKEAAAKSEPEDGLEKTVMLHRRDFKKNADEEEDDIMSETVILKPGGSEKED